MKKLGTLLVSLVVVISTILPAQSALKFDYQSTSATQATYAAALRDMVRTASGSGLTLTTGPTGTFGGTYLDMTAGPVVQWVGLDNGPIGSAAISILWRIIPIASGAPAATKGLLSLGGFDNYNNSAFGSFNFGITTLGKLEVIAGNVATGTNYFNLASFGTALTFVANQPTDIWFIWDGTTTAGAAQLWQAQAGNAATLVASLTAANAATGSPMVRGQVPQIVSADLARVAQNNAFHINEIAIFDNYISNPGATYGARTGFVTSTVFEGYDSSDPGISNVLNGTAYTIAGTSLTGNYVGPTTSQVASGVSFGSLSALSGTNVGAGFNTDPGVANVANGTTYKILNVGLTGTQGATADPGISNVRLGTGYSISGASKTGTLAVPSPSAVLLGTATDNTTGLRDDAIPANVLNGIVYGDGSKTGTLQFNINFPKVILGL